MKKDSLLFLRIKSFPNYKIQVSAKFGQKKPAKSRQHYEEKRLLVITEEFGKALSAGDKATMDSILFLMSYYYQEPCFLVAKETKEEYQKTFIAIRQQYSNFLFECYKEKKCTQKDINRLFGFCINAYPDANMARGVIDYVYTNEKNYLFSTGKASAVQFEIAATYFLSVLITYNHKEIKDISSRNDLIMRGYSKLFELPVSQYYRDLYKRNLKRYLAEKYEVYPPE